MGVKFGILALLTFVLQLMSVMGLVGDLGSPLKPLLWEEGCRF